MKLSKTKMTLLFLAVVCICTLSDSANAQIFRRFRPVVGENQPQIIAGQTAASRIRSFSGDGTLRPARRVSDRFIPVSR